MAADVALETGVWEQAALLYKKLLKPEGDRARSGEDATLYLGLGRALFMSGSRDSAFVPLRKAFEWFRGERDQARMIEIATLPGYLHSGEPGFFNLYGELLEELPSDSPALGSVLCSYGVVQFNNLGDYAGAERTLLRALEIGRTTGDRDLQAKCLTALAFVDTRRGRLEEARGKVDRAGTLLEGSGDEYAIMHYVILRYQILIDGGVPSEAIPFLDRWVESAARSRDAFSIGASQFSRSRVDLLFGNWDSARRRLAAGLAAKPDHVFLLLCRCSLEYAVGDFGAGDLFRDRLTVLSERTPPGPYTAHVHAASTAVARARQSGNSDGLHGLVPSLRKISEFSGTHPFILFRARILLAWIAALTRNAEESRRAYKDLRRLPALNMVHAHHMERAMGVAAHAYGDHLASERHLREALRWTRYYGDRPTEAWILCELAETLIHPPADPERYDEAGHLLSGSRDAAVRLRMPPLVSRTREKLSGLSGLLVGGRPDHAHFSRREREILGLIAEGLTNKAIAGRLGISVYTVGNHVRNVLEKTGAENRTEAVVLARKSGRLE